ncbi:hypothetical protein FA10DRAFT_199374 [Acaromyces ingoldii]|uniref:Tautomerase cis-CaaD-like domain-containing protein n=1 Tax=Acaromyces ingoldii TaxID=215250 RepID=A0A316YA82_9BASI|nr:hypothetical protein FA10DRAFT_199374 [Acaromyces ingoldii]PWN86760.1 hypothetical protein FA10DRAFT_199374 [Acaromyces ingoldii]
MPMCDIFLPSGCFKAEVETKLVSTVSDLIVDHEIRRWSELIGGDTTVIKEAAGRIAWMFVHHFDNMYVASAQTSLPHYKFVITIPEGTIDDRFAPAISRDIFSALKEAEGEASRGLSARVWIIIREVKDGMWCAGNRPMPLQTMKDFLENESKTKSRAEL